jgi:hypothetical protein
VLHTWTRDLRFHPHIHCIVTGGGWAAERQRWIASRADYLLPVRVLGALFRAKLLDALARACRRGKLRLSLESAPADTEAFGRMLAGLWRKPWVVYAKRPFGGPEQVVRYLGRYTHRVGISNQRLVRFDEQGVTFRTKNGKQVTLDGLAFLSRFVEHVLPSRFVKIRHFGLLAPAHLATAWTSARAALRPPEVPTECRAAPPAAGVTVRVEWQMLLLDITGIDLAVCRACGARAVDRRALPPVRAPPREAA